MKKHQLKEHIAALESLLSKNSDRFSDEEVKLVKSVIQGFKDLETEIVVQESGGGEITNAMKKKSYVDIAVNLLKLASYGSKVFDFLRDILD